MSVANRVAYRIQELQVCVCVCMCFFVCVCVCMCLDAVRRRGRAIWG